MTSTLDPVVIENPRARPEHRDQKSATEPQRPGVFLIINSLERGGRERQFAELAGRSIPLNSACIWDVRRRRAVCLSFPGEM